ncbi:MAG: hypothetical protein ACOYKZ_04255 [Chlamydiia bacterium]
MIDVPDIRSVDMRYKALWKALSPRIRELVGLYRSQDREYCMNEIAQKIDLVRERLAAAPPIEERHTLSDQLLLLQSDLRELAPEVGFSRVGGIETFRPAADQRRDFLNAVQAIQGATEIHGGERDEAAQPPAVTDLLREGLENGLLTRGDCRELGTEAATWLSTVEETASRPGRAIFPERTRYLGHKAPREQLKPRTGPRTTLAREDGGVGGWQRAMDQVYIGAIEYYTRRKHLETRGRETTWWDNTVSWGPAIDLKAVDRARLPVLWQRLKEKLEFVFEGEGIGFRARAMLEAGNAPLKFLLSRILMHRLDQALSQRVTEITSDAVGLCPDAHAESYEGCSYFEPFENNQFIETKLEGALETGLLGPEGIQLLQLMKETRILPSNQMIRRCIHGGHLRLLRALLNTWVSVKALHTDSIYQGRETWLGWMLMESVVCNQREIFLFLLGEFFGTRFLDDPKERREQVDGPLVRQGGALFRTRSLARLVECGLLDAVHHDQGPGANNESKVAFSELLIQCRAALSETTYLQLERDHSREAFPENDYRALILNWAKVSEERRYVFVPEDVIVAASHGLEREGFKALVSRGIQYTPNLLNRLLVVLGHRSDGHELLLELMIHVAIHCGAARDARPEQPGIQLPLSCEGVPVIAASSFECVIGRNLPELMVQALTNSPLLVWTNDMGHSVRFDLPSAKFMEGAVSGLKFLRRGTLAVLQRWPAGHPLPRKLFFAALQQDVFELLLMSHGAKAVCAALMALLRATGRHPLSSQEMLLLQERVLLLTTSMSECCPGANFTTLVVEALKYGSVPQDGIEKHFDITQLTKAVEAMQKETPQKDTLEAYLFSHGWSPSEEAILYMLAEGYDRAILSLMRLQPALFPPAVLSKMVDSVCQRNPHQAQHSMNFLFKLEACPRIHEASRRQLLAKLVQTTGAAEAGKVLNRIRAYIQLSAEIHPEKHYLGLENYLLLWMMENRYQGPTPETVRELLSMGYEIAPEHLASAVVRATSEIEEEGTSNGAPQWQLGLFDLGARRRISEEGIPIDAPQWQFGLPRLAKFYSSAFAFTPENSIHLLTVLRRDIRGQRGDAFVNRLDDRARAHLATIFDRMSQSIGEYELLKVINQLRPGGLEELQSLLPMIFSQQNLVRANHLHRPEQTSTQAPGRTRTHSEMTDTDLCSSSVQPLDPEALVNSWFVDDNEPPVKRSKLGE